MNQKVSIMHQLKKKYNSNPFFKISLQVLVSYVVSFLIAVWIFQQLVINKVQIETLAPPNSLYNTLYIFGIILVETIIIILLLCFFKKINIIKILDVFISFVALAGISSFFFASVWVPPLVAIILVLVKEFWKNQWFKNALIFVIVGFFSAYLAYSLGILPIFALLVLIAVYDIIAVFKTKHMVYLAKSIVGQNTLFVMDFGKDKSKTKSLSPATTQLEQKTISPNLRTKLNLGTGDFALPLIGVLALYSQNLYFGIIGFVGVVVGLLLTIFLLFSKSHKALPAIPLQVFVLVVLYGICLLLA